MTLVTYIILLVVAGTAISAPVEKPFYEIKDAPVLFEKFVQDYKKVYKDGADRAEHYKAFVESLKVINKANAESDSATFDINEFADYTEEQRKHLTGLLVQD